MKLIGKLKTQVDNAASKEEKKEAIKQAGMLLTDDELEQVSGGADGFPDFHTIEKDDSLDEGITRVKVGL